MLVKIMDISCVTFRETAPNCHEKHATTGRWTTSSRSQSNRVLQLHCVHLLSAANSAVRATEVHEDWNYDTAGVCYCGIPYQGMAYPPNLSL